MNANTIRRILRRDGSLIGEFPGADIREAMINAVATRADLRGADLRGAHLGRADLGGANLGGADLGGAYLGRAKASVARPALQLGPIGSRADWLLAIQTNKGIQVRAGCWAGDLDAFAVRVRERHGENVHAREYAAAIELIRRHFELWPATREGGAA